MQCKVDVVVVAAAVVVRRLAERTVAGYIAAAGRSFVVGSQSVSCCLILGIAVAGTAAVAGADFGLGDDADVGEAGMTVPRGCMMTRVLTPVLLLQKLGSSSSHRRQHLGCDCRPSPRPYLMRTTAHCGHTQLVMLVHFAPRHSMLAEGLGRGAAGMGIATGCLMGSSRTARTEGVVVAVATGLGHTGIPTCLSVMSWQSEAC